MDNRSRDQNDPAMPPRLAGKTRRWPRTVGITGLILCHLAFFLPLRAFIPVVSELDLWWGIGLVLADEILLVMLIRAGLRKGIRNQGTKGE